MDYQQTCQLIPLVHLNSICTFQKRHNDNRRKQQLRKSMKMSRLWMYKGKKNVWPAEASVLVMRHKWKSSYLIFLLRLLDWQLENYLFTSKRITSDWKSPRDKNLVSKMLSFIFKWSHISRKAVIWNATFIATFQGSARRKSLHIFLNSFYISKSSYTQVQNCRDNKREGVLLICCPVLNIQWPAKPG